MRIECDTVRYSVVFAHDIFHPEYTFTLTDALRIGYAYLQRYPEADVQIKRSNSPHASDYEMFRDYIGWKPRTFVQSDKGIYLVNHGGHRYKRVYMIVGKPMEGKKRVFYTTEKPEKR